MSLTLNSRKAHLGVVETVSTGASESLVVGPLKMPQCGETDAHWVSLNLLAVSQI